MLKYNKLYLLLVVPKYPEWLAIDQSDLYSPEDRAVSIKRGEQIVGHVP